MVAGNAGQLLHAGLNENHKDYHYSLVQGGRTYNEQVISHLDASYCVP